MKRDFGIVFWIHLFFIILAYSSPFWLDWRVVTAGIILLQIQFLVIEGCILTQMEAGKDKDMTFGYYYLSKAFPKLDKLKTKYFIRYGVSAIAFLLAFIFQYVFHYTPLVKF
ncbi:MAG: hypothetical protein P4L74_03675 [Candidatus Doudnabacteria bacterium]|nr:hypothetical protein [Candidatus Doudnabacteria bacterium]